MKSIFVAGGDETDLSRTEKMLKPHYRALGMVSIVKMLSLLESARPDMILLDAVGSDMNGVRALKHVKSQKACADIPVIVLSNNPDPVAEAQFLFMGAADYIKRPIDANVLLGRIKARLESDGAELIRAKRFRDMQNGIMSILAEMISDRDRLTGKHIWRTSEYTHILLMALLHRGIYSNETHNWRIDTLIPSARLHDVGKIVISDTILNKPGRLSAEEFSIIKTHTTVGEHVIEKMIAHVGDGAFLSNAKIFASTHHERWDGAGYPRGLKGLDIPLQGRILAISDVYDALISERPYKVAYTHEDAEQIIMSEAGTHFDPLLVDLFLDVREQFREVERNRPELSPQYFVSAG